VGLKKNKLEVRAIERGGGDMVVFVFNGDGGFGKKVTESGFAYDSTANVGRKRKAERRVAWILFHLQIEGKRVLRADDRKANGRHFC
jgi:hypothetical protein